MPTPADQNLLRAREVVDLGDALQGCADPIAVGVDFDGFVYAAAQRTSDRGDASRSAAGPDEEWVVLRTRNGRTESFTAPSPGFEASFIQAVPEGVMLVGARSSWRPTGADRNAVTYDWSGRECARFTLGDGIQDVRVTPKGTIWVSYFDEGVFGNAGWGSSGPAPIGETGLVAFSAQGVRLLSFDATAAGTDSICDAYAMNLASESEVWVYFYTEFSLVRIRKGQYSAWDLSAAPGAHALAVRGDRVLLWGGYQQQQLGRLFSLGSEKVAHLTATVSIEDEHGESLRNARGIGIGSALYLVKNRRLFCIDNWS